MKQHSVQQRDEIIASLKSMDAHQPKHLRLDDLIIRPVQHGDLNGLAALFNAGQKRSAAPALNASIRQRIEDTCLEGLRHVAICADEIIGQTCLKLQQPAGLLTIFVREDSRRSGVGTALLSYLLAATAESLDLERVELDVLRVNVPAIRLYQQFGFAVDPLYANQDGKVLHMSRSIERQT